MSRPSPYTKCLLSRNLKLHITQVGNNIKENLQSALENLVANKCTEDGYICPVYITIIQYSAGTVQEDYILFHVVFSCFVANPAEGDIFVATIKTLTLAGVHAEVVDNHGNVPITVFIAHDANRPIHALDSLHEKQQILVKVIGTRFELNDPCVYVIADLQQLSEVQNEKQQHNAPLETSSMDIILEEDGDSDHDMKVI